MSGIVYRAVYSGEHLSHFKYIDKWKSKAGNWVYKYKEDISEDAENLKRELLRKVKEHNRNLVQRPEKENSSGSGGWHSTGRDAALSEKQRYEESVKGNDRTRVRKVKDSSGKTSYRREYQDSAQQQDVSRKVRSYNESFKSNHKLARFVMDFNDKYGPKYVSTIHANTASGENYVLEYKRNLFGNRAIDAETYTYYDSNRVKRKRRNKHRSSVRK